MKTRTALWVLSTGFLSSSAAGFTVEVKGMTPIGHEWITVEAASEVRKGFQAVSFWGALTSDFPWGEKYGSDNYYLWSVVLGTRWVDLRGFSFSGDNWERLKCWQAVAQTHDSVQPDHFLRRSTDTEPNGWQTAAAAAIERFKTLFASAVLKAKTSPGAKVTIFDGGRTAKRYEVNEAYFLLGRAMHIVQDSFSDEHVTRMPTAACCGDEIVNVRSQIPVGGAPRHTHRDGLSKFMGPACVDVMGGDFSKLGDVIWESSGKPKSYVLRAVSATRRLFVLFWETVAAVMPMGTEAFEYAKQALSQYVDGWLRLGSKNSSVSAPARIPAGCGISEISFENLKNNNIAAAYFDQCVPPADRVSESLAPNTFERSKYDKDWSAVAEMFASSPIP